MSLLVSCTPGAIGINYTQEHVTRLPLIGTHTLSSAPSVILGSQDFVCNFTANTAGNIGLTSITQMLLDSGDEHFARFFYLDDQGFNDNWSWRVTDEYVDAETLSARYLAAQHDREALSALTGQLAPPGRTGVGHTFQLTWKTRPLTLTPCGPKVDVRVL